ncbi:MAG: hypothetical protein WC730_00650 [Patescibacteria group bacterium]|jgi:hypothetical protein
MKVEKEKIAPEEMREKLRTFFSDVAELEKKARDLYDSFLLDLAGTEAEEIITHIRDQEIGHMRIADELQSIMKSYPSRHAPSE